MPSSSGESSSLERFHKALEKGVSLYNSGHFFECHEVLESVWLEEEGDDKAFLQGLIKIAAAFHHYKKGTYQGMLDLLLAGRDVLNRFKPAYRGIKLRVFLRAVNEWIPIARRLVRGEVKSTRREIPPLVYRT